MYQRMIAERMERMNIAGVDPRHIEAFMRCEHGTLDGISPDQFNAEVQTCAACVGKVGQEQSESLAASYGL